MANPPFIKGLVNLVVNYDYVTAPVVHPFKQTFQARTVGGFLFRYSLGGSLQIHDYDELKKHRMLEPDRQEALVKEFHAEVEKYLNQTDHFWTFRWEKQNDRLEPAALLCRIDSKERPELVADLNCASAIKAIQDRGYVRNGFTVILSSITPNIEDAALNEENVKMLTPAQISQIKESEVYRKFGEAEAVAAMQLRSQIAQEMQKVQTEQVHGETAHCFKVTTRVADGDFTLSWARKAGYKNSTIVGFMKRGRGFPDTVTDEKGKITGYTGEPIIDGIEDGAISPKVEEGEEYSITLFLEEWSSIFGRSIADRINCLVRIPTAPETKAFEERMMKMALPKIDSQTPEQKQLNHTRAQLQKIIGPISGNVERRTAINDFEQEKIAWIKRQGYPAAREREEIRQLKMDCEKARMENC